MHPVLVRGTRAALGTAALCLPALALAQQPAPSSGTASAAGSIEVGAFGQYNLLRKSTTDFTSNTPTALGLRLHVGLGAGLGLEFEGAYAGTTRAARPGLTDTDASYQQLAARATFTSTPIVGRTAIILGAGIVRSDYDYTFRYGPSGMAGLRIPVGTRFVLRADGIVNLLPSTGDTEVGLRAGLHTVLGPYAGRTATDRQTGNRTVVAPGAIELGAFGGLTRHATDWDQQASGTVGGRIGVALTSRSQVEFEFGFGVPAIEDEALTSTTARPRNGTDYNYVPLVLRYNYNVPVGKDGGVIVGLGVHRTDYGWTHNWGPTGLVGYRRALWRGLQLRGDVVANSMLSPGALDLGARLGASWVLKGF